MKTNELPVFTSETVPPTDLEPPVVDCWVAREVYGIDNPRWLDFRAWMREDSPSWFRNLYLSRGESIAHWLRPHKLLKTLVRFSMELTLRMSKRSF